MHDTELKRASLKLRHHADGRTSLDHDDAREIADLIDTASSEWDEFKRRITALHVAVGTIPADRFRFEGE